MRIAIIGSRAYPWPENVKLAVDFLCQEVPGWVLVSGGAKGPDSWSEEYAKDRGVQTIIFLPDWAKFGKRAGMVRNHDIVGQADLIIAFWDGFSRGTKYSIDLARSQGKPVWTVLA